MEVSATQRIAQPPSRRGAHAVRCLSQDKVASARTVRQAAVRLGTSAKPVGSCLIALLKSSLIILVYQLHVQLAFINRICVQSRPWTTVVPA